MPLFEKRNVNLVSPPSWLVDSVGLPTYSGENVTVERSLTIPGVLAGFSILTEDTSSLPLILYRRLKRGKERANDHPLYALLHDEPNPEMTSMVFREIIMGHLLGWGNFFAQMIWDRRGVVRELWPLKPSNMEIGRKDGERVYLYQKEDGSRIAFRQEEILHIPAFGFDGVRGYSRIALSRNAIALAMATEKYGSRVFQNDARPSIVLTYPRALDDKAKTNLLESWSQVYGSASNAAKTAILEEGLDIKTIGFPPEDAQFIETQKWSVQQVSRVFRIPPHMLGDVEKSTSWGSGIEQQEIGYVTHTLRPWTVRIEQQMNKDLMLKGEKRDYFFEHLFDEMIRTDTKSRMEAYAIAITNGVLTRNEVRERENLLPYDGGDDPLFPLNMTTTIEKDQGTQEQEEPVRNITPLLMDAARRISKRDENELNGALNRYKDKPEKWNAWLEQFYKRDYPAFILATMQPFIDARLVDVMKLQSFIQQVTDRRGEDATNGNFDALDPVELLPHIQEACYA